ncbi:DUF4843 domain-containing protein [Sphingobacterium tabacisoli]|uniref:DUF4843 domain-containing protein n=1 Tax=Sphingobacterium tabacisoli TaxID=2044855 RepID=A0ABW5L0S9_9SPHI|nr:DUF4843 domain-containing protein [Sphingobacterium tabacisoli]
MKSNFIITCLLLLTMVACKDSHNMLEFDIADSYVYFALPDDNTKSVERYIDSTYYSFSLDENITITEKVLKIPVHIGGAAADKDRMYALVVDGASQYDPDMIKLTSPVIKAGKYNDTLYVTVKRDPYLLTNQMVLHLGLQANDDFKVGNVHNSTMKIVVDDILREPKWWNTWKNYFGPFKKEVFQKWMQLYYLGADPSPELGGNNPGPFYYWDNMPSYANADSYPVTFNYITILKQFFENNVVYPNGDTTQERILLP